MMRRDDLRRLEALRARLTGESIAAKGQPISPVVPTSWVENVSRHPLFLALIGFALTGILGGYLTYWFNYQNQTHEFESSTRNNAIAAVSDMSDLVNERRERAALVISAIRRTAPESEINARKLAYDEAYIRWNAKMPGDLLRIRAGLGLLYRSSYERYIDGLTNFNILLYGTDASKLLHGQQIQPNPGLLSIMDTCLTQASDAYRLDSFKISPATLAIISNCKFYKAYSQTISCFSMISESLYSAVESKGNPVIPISDEQVVEACSPP
jgi:hypothetical protein